MIMLAQLLRERGDGDSVEQHEATVLCSSPKDICEPEDLARSECNLRSGVNPTPLPRNRSRVGLILNDGL